MFISKKDLGDLKSKAGATGILHSQIARLTNELNAHKGQTGQQVAALKKELDFDDCGIGDKILFDIQNKMFGLPIPEKRTIKTVIKELTDRLDYQEKMQKMLFAHLGIEYAKTTEETRAGKQEKEVLRKIKKQKSAKAS
jgi:hypothetical protein